MLIDEFNFISYWSPRVIVSTRSQFDLLHGQTCTTYSSSSVVVKGTVHRTPYKRWTLRWGRHLLRSMTSLLTSLALLCYICFYYYFFKVVNIYLVLLLLQLCHFFSIVLLLQFWPKRHWWWAGVLEGLLSELEAHSNGPLIEYRCIFVLKLLLIHWQKITP